MLSGPFRVEPNDICLSSALGVVTHLALTEKDYARSCSLNLPKLFKFTASIRQRSPEDPEKSLLWTNSEMLRSLLGPAVLAPAIQEINTSKFPRNGASAYVMNARLSLECTVPILNLLETASGMSALQSSSVSALIGSVWHSSTNPQVLST